MLAGSPSLPNLGANISPEYPTIHTLIQYLVLITPSSTCIQAAVHHVQVYNKGNIQRVVSKVIEYREQYQINHLQPSPTFL